MKKNYLFSAFAACCLLFASCGQEEILSDYESNKVVSIDVAVPGATTRAMPEVANMKCRCIMQVVNAEGTAIAGENMRQVVEVTTAKISFTFAEPKEDYSVIFWADYASTVEKDHIYNTANLPEISYAQNKNNMFTAAGDAFCGKVQKGVTKATLKRPFNKVNIKTSNTEAFAGYTHIAIGNINVPDAFNVFSGNCGTTPKPVRLEKREMDNATAGEWTSLYVFAPANGSSLELTFPITLSKGAEETAESTQFEVKATGMPSDANHQANVDIPEIPAKNITIDVDIDGEFTQPADPNALAVGDYINAAGEKVTDASQAVAVIYALPGEGITDNSSYGEGKTVKAYALGLTKATNRIAVGDLSTFNLDVTTADNYSGFAFDAALKTKLQNVTTEQSKLFNAYYTTQLPALTGQNLSAWYIPSYAQLAAAAALDNTALKEALKGAYTGDYYLASSSVAEYTPKTGSAYNNIQGSIYKITDGTLGKQEGIGSTASAIIFPALTIFN